MKTIGYCNWNKYCIYIIKNSNKESPKYLCQKYKCVIIVNNKQLLESCKQCNITAYEYITGIG